MLKKMHFSFTVLTVLVFVIACVGINNVQAQAVQGVYAGGHKTTGMGGGVQYYYSLDFKAAEKYEFKSYFIMGDSIYELVEAGSYELSGTKVTIVPDGGDAVSGSLNSDGTVTIAIKPSMMASSRVESTLAPVVNPVAGVYTATFQGPTVVEVTLFLTYEDTYFYIAAPQGEGAEAYHESGSYSVAAGEITFVVEESGEEVVGVVQSGQVTAPFILSARMGMRMEIDLSL